MENGQVTSNMSDVPTANVAETPEAPRLEGDALVVATWEELGFKIKPVGSRLFVRTETPPQKQGMIWLPPELWAMYGQRLGSKALVTGTVLSCGPRVKDAPAIGTRVVFFRLPFGWTHKMTDGTFVGWVEAAEIVGVSGSDEIIPFVQ